MSESVFEVVDTTDEEIYFPMGVFLTLDAANKALDECTPKNMPSDYDHDDFCRIEIRERKVGWSGIGKTVQVREWISNYNEETDEYDWIRKPEEK